jgi:hypothetical protein
MAASIHPALAAPVGDGRLRLTTLGRQSAGAGKEGCDSGKRPEVGHDRPMDGDGGKNGQRVVQPPHSPE